MAYINTRAEEFSASGSSAIRVARLAPLDPSETLDSAGEYPSGTVDLNHALSVGDFVFSASNKGVDDNTKIDDIISITNELTEIVLSKPLVSDINEGDWLTFDQFQNAALGGKFSFSKFPVPSITDQVPLFDIVTGQRLVDGSGIGLVTDTEVAVSEIARKDNATSVTLPVGPGAPPIPIEEVFQEQSETSNTLLGVPRGERQLSLFSDVSTLGLDEDDWEFFTQTGGFRFGPWERRESELFGRHYNASFIEQTEEQALEIGAFPVPYSYPFGPRWANIGVFDEGRYNQYLNFIRLGNDLYDFFGTTENESLYGSDFKEQFLDREKVTIADQDVVFPTLSEDEAFKLIDTWTRTWVDINDSILPSPISDDPITAVDINRITGSTPLFSDTRPGYSTSQQRFSYLQSKRTFRYQPGRISGFTFGVRASSDSGSASNILEWGTTNPTDQYVFQLRGATLNIVRRSTVPLETEVVEALGLDPVRGQELKPSGDPNDINPRTGSPREYFTVEIPRDLWNVDPLNGNGPSRYLLTTEEVTMYKIEFSWYGAIGANFYVYIPVGNGEARWVLVHRLIIENKLGQACLEDPNFRFRYSLNIRDTARLRSPQFVYKYGASMYIDGGDEGTTTLHSYSSGERSIAATRETPILGVYPKELITNKDGFEQINKKTIVPRNLSVSSNEAARIRIGQCSACPGFGHNYNLGLKSGEIGRLANFKFNDSSLSSVTINPDIIDPAAEDLLQLSDNGAKIIADGIYSTYIRVDEDSFILGPSNEIIGYTSANLERIVQDFHTRELISGTSSPSNPSSGFDSSGIVFLSDGTSRNLFDFAGAEGDTYPDQMRLTNYDAIAASDIPLTGTEIDLQFLNPQPRDSGGAFAEFEIGITDKKPIDDNGVLKFEVEPGVFSEDLGVEDVLVGEYTPSTTRRTRDGFERSERNVGRHEVFEIDFRIPQPRKEDETDKSGNCSRATINVQSRVQLEGIFTLTNPQSGVADGPVYLFLDEGFFFPDGILRGGELGINGSGSDVFITSEETRFISGGVVRSFVTVTDFPSGFGNDDAVTIELTPILLTARKINTLKVFNFNPYPLYAFIRMRDNSAINSISIAEKVGNSRNSVTPRWIVSTNGSMDIDDSGGRAAPDLPPTNFVSQNRLDSGRVDNQCAQRLRPLTVKDSFYIGANETKLFDLENIYNFDREVIVPDLFNIEATFVIAEPTDAASGDVQMTLNTAEQQ